MTTVFDGIGRLVERSPVLSRDQPLSSIPPAAPSTWPIACQRPRGNHRRDQSATVSFIVFLVPSPLLGEEG